MARKAVARYLAAPGEEAPTAIGLTARDLARRWPSLPRLHPEEAEGFAADIMSGRDALPPVALPWE